MNDVFAKIMFNERLNGDYFRIGIETRWNNYTPGQFVMLKILGIVARPKGRDYNCSPDLQVGESEVFLRRPFSICRLQDGILEICYKVVGKGTSVLSEAVAEESVWVLGPLGKGFNVPSRACGDAFQRSKQSILVAGGYGIAPLLGLAEQLCSPDLQVGKSIARPKGRDYNVHLFYGARSKNHLLYLDEFREFGIETHLATEDGSLGEKGIVTDVLEIFLRSMKHEARSMIFSCGPHKMLEEITRLAKKYKISDCQLSLESYMACGIGVCMGCAVKTPNGKQAFVCKDGPVFSWGDSL